MTNQNDIMVDSNTLKYEISPIQFYLSQNYPNPFREKTVIKYCVAYKTRVQITIYNSAGKEIEKLVDAEKEAGTYGVGFKLAKGSQPAWQAQPDRQWQMRNFYIS